MKLLTISMIISAAGLAVAEANPARFVVVETHKPIEAKEGAVISTFHRIGLAGAGASPAQPIPHTAEGYKYRHHGGCRSAIKAGATAFTNWIRVKLGFDRQGNAHMEATITRVKTPVSLTPQFMMLPKPSFPARIHRALNSLGPWEGRAVSFVLGCGIGVLLRMFFVLTVLAVRAIRARREASVDYYIASRNYDRLEEDGAETEHLIFVAPPEYVDEKPPVVPNAAA